MRFKNNMYKEKAVELLARDTINTNISNEDAFLVLIHGLSKEKIDNLCNRLKDLLAISFEEAYSITQKMKDNKYASKILKIAIDIISDGDNIGTEIIYGHNSSSYISHSIREAILSFEFATMLKLDGKYAFNYGLLHDYGRKYTHKMDHIIEGFQELYDLGLEDFSKASISHSFINGGKYCCNERAKEGFSVDENGQEHYLDEEEYDDIYEVLKTAKYNDYDKILNLADLMATSYGIVSPEERIRDIEKRRDDVDTMPNRKYFLVSFTNMLIDFLNKMNIPNSFEKLDFNLLNLEDIKERFKIVSKAFFEAYRNIKKAWNIEYVVDNKKIKEYR